MRKGLPHSSQPGAKLAFADTLTSRRAHRGALLAPLVLATLLPAGAIRGQDPAATKEPLSPASVEHLEVELVEIDVVVLDRRGRPVSGLGVEDFELRVDGWKVPITHFEALSPAAAPSAAAERVAAVDDAPPTGQQALARRDSTLHTVLYFDHATLPPQGRRQVISQLGTFVTDRLARGGRVMILEHDQGVRVAHPFTGDAQELQQALVEVEEPNAKGHSMERQRLTLLRELVSVHDTCPELRGSMWGCPCDDILLSLTRNHATDARRLRQQQLDGLSQAIAALGGLPGPTELLYVSGGMPAHAGLESFHFLIDLCPPEAYEFQNLLRNEMTHYSGAQLFRILGAAANAQRVTLYALDATGVESPGSSSVEFDFAGRGGRPSPLNDQVRKENRQGSLFALADETGGKAILDTSEPGWALGLLAGETEGSYVLGFSPGHAPEGAVHRVAVRAAGRDLTVRHRRSFRHATREETMGERTLAARILGVGDNPWGIVAAWVAATEADGDRGRSGVELRIPAAELTTLEGEGHRRGLVTVILAVPRPDGTGSEVRRKDLAALYSPEAPSIDLVVELDLPAGVHRLGVGVWDRLADRAVFFPLSAAVHEGGEASDEASADSPSA